MAARQEGRGRATKVLLGLAALTLAACGSTETSPPAAPPEAFFYSRLYDLSRAYESRDVEKIASFYAPEATSVTRDLPFRNDDGLPALRTSLSRYAGEIRTMKIVLSDAVQVRMSPGVVSTVQGFHARCQTRDGTEITWNGRHGATWEVRDGVWRIVSEYFADPPEVKPARPFVVAVAGVVAVAPEPMRVELVRKPPETAGPDLEAPAAPARAPAAAPVVGPAAAPGTASRVQFRAATFVTPDWTGEPVYVIHFSSFRERRRAELDAARIGKESGIPARTVEVALGGRGTWYRVVAGEFRTQEEAFASRNGLLGRKVQGVGLVYRMASGSGRH